MYGRAASAYRLIALGTTALGAALGGALARLVDLRAPWLVAGCTELAVLAVVGRSLTSRAVERRPRSRSAPPGRWQHDARAARQAGRRKGAAC